MGGGERVSGCPGWAVEGAVGVGCGAITLGAALVAWRRGYVRLVPVTSVECERRVLVAYSTVWCRLNRLRTFGLERRCVDMMSRACVSVLVPFDAYRSPGARDDGCETRTSEGFPVTRSFVDYRPGVFGGAVPRGEESARLLG
ncbi:hypothetical protein GOBAR_AA25414 [Gossypium barbadense]|uniref:Uncharacterized protein n=1 Tax=Gossypium barbadense TaxID=3634 RepID=A0A2P5WVZ4_GOSBA|nr:hypothetical protein GOBAR_AA25414 [Gossypium barbadense]